MKWNQIGEYISKIYFQDSVMWNWLNNKNNNNNNNNYYYYYIIA